VAAPSETEKQTQMKGRKRK